MLLPYPSHLAVPTLSTSQSLLLTLRSPFLSSLFLCLLVNHAVSFAVPALQTLSKRFALIGGSSAYVSNPSCVCGCGRRKRSKWFLSTCQGDVKNSRKKSEIKHLIHYLKCTNVDVNKVTSNQVALNLNISMTALTDFIKCLTKSS